MKKRNSLGNNSGFSLVELVVTAAIMAILLGTMALSFSNVTKYRTKECKNKIATTLNAVQTTALSKSVGGESVESVTGAAKGTYAVFFRWANDNCTYMISVVQGEVKDVQKVGKAGMTVDFVSTSGTTTLDDSSAITVAGAPRTISKVTSATVLDDVKTAALANGAVVAFNRENGAFLPSSSDGDLSSISVTKGDYSYSITIHAKTGKIVK